MFAEAFAILINKNSHALEVYMNMYFCYLKSYRYIQTFNFFLSEC